MALAHENLYRGKSLSRINMNDYISEVVRLLSTSLNVSGERVRIDLELEELESVIDIAIPCGLVLNELLSNSFKYAFPGDRTGCIQVKLHREGPHHLRLIIADNGVGFKPGFDIAKTQSLGIPMVMQIIKNQLHGTVDLQTDQGVRWQVRFRDDLYRERV